MNAEITCDVNCQNSLGEGCLWDGETASLWWLDIARPSSLHRFTPRTGSHEIHPSPMLLTAMAQTTSGEFILAAESGIYFFNPGSAELTPFCSPEPNIPHNRFNDAACDPQGRLWAGTMMQNVGPAGEDLPITASSGNLFRVTADGQSLPMQSQIGVSNGPCWSPDGATFYFSDSMAQIIYAYDFDGVTGQISNRRIFNDTKDYGYPDGATVDAEGFVWSARWDAGCLLRLDPHGRIDRVIETPCTRPTCVVFGGDDLSTLYFTSSRAHLDDTVLNRFPLQGGVFSLRPGVKGLLKHKFAIGPGG